MQNKGVMREIRMDIRSDLAMNIISYLIKEENFIFVGNEKEIWLENLSHPAVQLVYLNQRNIFNSEQAGFLMSQLQRVRNQIRRRYLLWRLNVMILNLDEFSSAQLAEDKSWLKTVSVKDAEDAVHNRSLKALFPALENNSLDRTMSDLVVEIQNVTKKKALEVHHTLTYQQRPFATYGFIGLLLAAFLAVQLLSGSALHPLTLVRFGAKYNPLIAGGEYWRLLTANLLHANVLYLLFNVIFIYQFGKILETIIGWWRMLLLMIGSALMGTLFSFAFVPQVSLGASAVAYGILGGLLFLGIENRKMFMNMVRRLVGPIVIFSIIWTMLDATIDAYGHFGGFIGGFLMASLTGLPGYRQYINRFVLASASFVLLLVGLFSRGNDLVERTDYHNFNLALIFYHEEHGHLERATRLMETLGIAAEREP